MSSAALAALAVSRSRAADIAETRGRSAHEISEAVVVWLLPAFSANTGAWTGIGALDGYQLLARGSIIAARSAGNFAGSARAAVTIGRPRGPMIALASRATAR